MARTTVRQLAEMKERGERIPMITAYDYTTAALADSAGIPVVLVGDSLGMVVLGYESTIPVTMEDIIHHTRMVVRGNRNSLIVADLPFMTYQVEPAQALRNAARLLQEGGAHTVKLEGGESIAPTIRRIVDCDIPVMAHIGVTPQSVNAFGGYRVRGRSVEQARQLVRDALAVEAAGAYAVVLELVPAPWQSSSHSGLPSQPSASAPVQAVTARCRCSTICSGCSPTSFPGTPGGMPSWPRRSAKPFPNTPRTFATVPSPRPPRAFPWTKVSWTNWGIYSDLPADASTCEKKRRARSARRCCCPWAAWNMPEP